MLALRNWSSNQRPESQQDSPGPISMERLAISMARSEKFESARCDPGQRLLGPDIVGRLVGFTDGRGPVGLRHMVSWLGSGSANFCLAAQLPQRNACGSFSHFPLPPKTRKT